MKAAVGDRLVVGSRTTDRAPREGRIVGVHHPGGEPPYDVVWGDTGATAVVYPGSDAHVEHGAKESAESTDVTMHARTWQVQVDLVEEEGSVTAHAVLHGAALMNLEGRGSADAATTGSPSVRVLSELAAGQALQRLANGLLASAQDERLEMPERSGGANA